MKFLFASDSFKGTLSSERITQLLRQRQGGHFRAVRQLACLWLTAGREPLTR